MYDIHIPRSGILKKHIAEFTILKKERFKPVNYLAFPHPTTSIVFYSSTRICFDSGSIRLQSDTHEKPRMGVLGKYLSPLLISYRDAVDEIAVNFTPTGINHFFDASCKNIAAQPFQLLEKEPWNTFSATLFEARAAERMELLEQFLQTQFRLKNLTEIEDIIEMMDSDLSVKICEIAARRGKSVKTINRLFHKHLGCSPVAYKKILRFRKSVNMNHPEINFTELCLNNTYYDSPHFTREFRKLTSLNPREFFRQLTKINHTKFNYIFI